MKASGVMVETGLSADKLAVEGLDWGRNWENNRGGGGKGWIWQQWHALDPVPSVLKLLPTSFLSVHLCHQGDP